MQLAVDIEGAAENLAGIDDREIPHAATFAEPAVADEQRARMMVEHHRQPEPALQVVAEGKAVQGRDEVDGDDGTAIRIHHAAGGDADAERAAMGGGERARDGGGHCLDDPAELRRVRRERLFVFGQGSFPRA